MQFNTQPARTALSILAVVAISLTLTACEECEEINVADYEDQLTAEEQAQVDEHGYFNLVGDCKEEAELACTNALPDECSIACSEGSTCTQVELEKIDCNDFIEWSNLAPGYDAGYKWKRKCLELAN